MLAALRSTSFAMNRFSRPPARTLALLGFSLLGALWANDALAQSITLNPAGIGRKYGFRESSTSATALWISRADCEAGADQSGDAFFFPLTLDGSFSSYELQVWVGGPGNDCSDPAARTGNSPLCWQVYKGVPTTNLPTIEVRVQDIVGMHKTTETPNGPGSGTVEDCQPEPGSTSAPQAVTLYFMFISGSGGTVVGNGVTWETQYALMGPRPPTGVEAGPGDTQVVLKWTPSNDANLRGYRFYCDPVPGSEGLTQSGTCPTSSFVPEEIPPSANECGGVDNSTAIEGHVKNLQNGRVYTVGVAGVDSVGNIGPLSNVVCATPEPTEDFYKLYRDAGGTAGGGFCSVGGVGGRSVGGFALAVASASAIALALRNRRRA